MLPALKNFTLKNIILWGERDNPLKRPCPLHKHTLSLASPTRSAVLAIVTLEAVAGVHGQIRLLNNLAAPIKTWPELSIT
jgi:hypothetical protein